MSREIIYSFIFADSSQTRRRQQLKAEEFRYRLRRRVAYPDGLKSYQLLAIVRESERLALEDLFGRFPITIERSQKDYLVDQLSSLLNLRNTHNGLND